MQEYQRSLKTAAVLLAVGLAVLPLFSGCTASTVIDPRVKQALSGNSRAQDAVDWLILNGDIVLPELVRRLGSAKESRADEAAAALAAMGDYGLQGAVKYYPQLNERGRQRILDMLAGLGTEDGVLRLLALSRNADAYGPVVEAISSMGDVALDFLIYQMNNEYYRDAVDVCLVRFGEQSLDAMVRATHSTNPAKTGRAFSILQRIGEPAVGPLVRDLLENADGEVDIEKAVAMMLSAYPEAAISAIIDTAVTGTGSQELAAALLDQIGSAQHMAYIINYAPQNATDAARGSLLARYLEKADVKTVVGMVLQNPTEESLHGLELALAANYYSNDVIAALLSRMTDADGPQSALYTTAGRLLFDQNYRNLAQAVIGQDANLIAAVLSSGAPANFAGDTLSLASANPALVQRLDSMLFSLPADLRNALMNSLAYANDTGIPMLLWNRYASDDAALSASAASAIITAVPAGAKLPYAGMDFLPYAAKLVAGLKSSDQQTRANAGDLVDRLPEGREHHALFMQLFQAAPSQKLFIVLAGHYGSAGGIAPNIVISAGGQQVSPRTVTLDIDTDVSGVNSSKYPDFKSIVEQSLPYLGLTAMAEGGEMTLEIDTDITPRYSWYSGNRGKCYQGAEAESRTAVHLDGSAVKTVNGMAFIAPPENPTAPSNIDDYRDDPEDAPMDAVFRICYIDSMYRAFGLEALLCLYNYDATSTLAAADGLWR